uniref:Uncharacterized protein n=1 Tax=Stomoxys calcitrans TaxID=35570 RepID=A0A1I8Q7J0_STOCA
MKFTPVFMGILLAAMTQTIFALETSRRAKRQDIPPVLDETKQLAAQSDEVIEQVLPLLPNTPAFANHRSKLEAYEKAFHDYKDQAGYNRRFASRFFTTLLEFMKTFKSDANNTAEHGEVVKYLNNAGLDKIRQHVEQKMERGEYRHLTRLG